MAAIKRFAGSHLCGCGFATCVSRPGRLAWSDSILLRRGAKAFFFGIFQESSYLFVAKRLTGEKKFATGQFGDIRQGKWPGNPTSRGSFAPSDR